MSGLVFTIPFAAVAVTAAQDVFEVLAPTRSRLELCRAFVGQYSDAGDAQDELLPIEIIYGYTTTGSGGTSVTPGKYSPWSRASGATCKVNNTTLATGGTPIILVAESFNVRAGWTFGDPQPDKPSQENERIFVEKAERIVVRLPAAPADSLTMIGWLKFKEIGMTSP